MFAKRYLSKCSTVNITLLQNVILCCNAMDKLVIVSAKVDEELKKRAEQLGINISALVRKALEEEVKRVELQAC